MSTHGLAAAVPREPRHLTAQGTYQRKAPAAFLLRPRHGRCLEAGKRRDGIGNLDQEVAVVAAVWASRAARARARRRQAVLDFGRPPEHDLRQIMNAIRYVDRSGTPWRYLPRDFPPLKGVYDYRTRQDQSQVNRTGAAAREADGILPVAAHAGSRGCPCARPPRKSAGPTRRRN